MWLNEACTKKYVGKREVFQHRGLLKQVLIWDDSGFFWLI